MRLFREIITDKNIPFGELRYSTILVTGATGVIGSSIIKALSAADNSMGLGVKLVGHGRNLIKGKDLAEKYNIEFISGDIRAPIPQTKLPDNIDYIFHCAAITQSPDMSSKPLDVAATMIDGTRNTLELAHIKHCKSYVYLSSMEVYGQTDKKEVTESDLGYLDTELTRNSYPISKRECEKLCIDYSNQYGTNIKIARLARTIGPGTPIDESDTRIASQFARKAVACEDIELHTQGKSIANCCHTFDAIRGLLTILLKGSPGEAYNIANSEASMTVREMAQLIATKICKDRIKVIVNVPPDINERGYNVDIGYTLNISKLKTLGWKPNYGLEEMFRHMIGEQKL